MNKYKIGSFYGLVKKQPQLLEFGGEGPSCLFLRGGGAQLLDFEFWVENKEGNVGKKNLLGDLSGGGSPVNNEKIQKTEEKTPKFRTFVNGNSSF